MVANGITRLKFNKVAGVVVGLWLCSQVVHAQQRNEVDKGNESAEMFNSAERLDSLAIDEALNGWWTTSQTGKEQRIHWWKEATYGMFIHWGVYAMAGNVWEGKKGGGYAEHLMRVKKIPRKKYLAYAKDFNPTGFHADTWARYAKAAGMGYLIITAKHHDGFAMFPTDYSTEYSLKSTAFKRDPMAELAAACRKEGLKFGFYYSHAFDWEDPNAPGNDWDYENPGGGRMIGGQRWYHVHPEWLPRIRRYVDGKAIPQILELIHKYHPDILWFDTPEKLPLSENLRILKAIRKADPNVVINGRLARTAPRNYGDYLNTADRPAEFRPIPAGTAWEAIPTTNESYGYSKTDTLHKSAAFQIQLLAKAVSKGGNILLNIGPKGDGTFDAADVRILDSIALWMKENKPSVIGASTTELPLQSWGVITKKGDSLFLHVFKYPNDGKLFVGGLLSKVKEARYLAGGHVISSMHASADGLELELAKEREGAADEVILLMLDGQLKAGLRTYLESNVLQNRLLAFDARGTDHDFDFGDGKPDRYYVSHWVDTSQVLSWNVAARKPAAFQIWVDEVQDTVPVGGAYEIKVGDQRFLGQVTNKGSGHHTTLLGSVTLAAGPSIFQIRPLSITGQELMRFLEIRLIPIADQQVHWHSKQVWPLADGTLSYATDAKGNRIPDFSHVGYHQGDRSLPDIPVCRTVSPPADGTYSDKIIQQAIDELARLPADQQGVRGTILLKRGTYRIAGTLHIRNSGIVLRGEGSEKGQTTLVATGRGQRTLLSISGYGERQVKAHNKQFVLDDYVGVGSFSLRVASAASFHQGQSVVIYRPATSQWIHDLQMDRIAQRKGTIQWKPSDFGLWFERTIVRISGNTLIMDNPMVMALDKKYGGGLIYPCSFKGRISEVGVEHIRFESEYVNETDEDHGWIAVELDKVKDAWVKDITAYYFGLSCVKLGGDSKQVTVTQSSCMDAKSLVTGGRRYSFFNEGQLNLFSDLYSRAGRHDYVTGARVAGPNVFYNCKATGALADIGPHHRWACGTLYDQISTDGEINVQDRGNWGSGHGWAGVTQVLWNCRAAVVTVQNPWVSGKNYCIGLIGKKGQGRLENRPDGMWEGVGKVGLQPASLYEAQWKVRH